MSSTSQGKGTGRAAQGPDATLDREALKALRDTIEQALRSKTPGQATGATLGAASSRSYQTPMAP